MDRANPSGIATCVSAGHRVATDSGKPGLNTSSGLYCAARHTRGRNVPSPVTHPNRDASTYKSTQHELIESKNDAENELGGMLRKGLLGGRRTGACSHTASQLADRHPSCRYKGPESQFRGDSTVIDEISGTYGSKYATAHTMPTPVCLAA